MFLEVYKIGCDRYNGASFVWDTDDMVVECYMTDSLHKMHIDGTVHIENLHILRVHDEERCIAGNRTLVPFKKPVLLGCGDIWYDRYVYNAFAGSMFEIPKGIMEIIIRDTYYLFRYEGHGWEDTSLRGALFLFKPTKGKFSNVFMDTVVKVSREEFMRKVVLGTL